MTVMTDAGHRATVLIITAQMGGGHTGAARELARRLEVTETRASSVDLLQAMQFGYGRGIAGFYRAQLRWAPWSYRAVYRSWRSGSAMASVANSVDTRMARRGLLATIEQTQPSVLVSDFNLASQVLGRLTEQGALDIPFLTFLTDFGVHPYWLHDRTAAYLSVSENTARTLRESTRAPVVVCGPLVAPDFEPNVGRRARARRTLGVAERGIVALVVAGAWGVGDIEETTADLEQIDGCTAVVVCGHNERLAARLRRKVKPSTRVLGFVDTMPELMNAADILVGNAGGLTAMEAFRSGLPVVTYRPIPAHGTDNADAMAAAGVTSFAHDRVGFVDLVHGLGVDGPRRRAQIEAARKLFPRDATDRITHALRLAGSTPLRATADPAIGSP